MTANVPEKRIDSQISSMSQFSEEKKELIKRMYCKDCSNDEFELFLSVAQHTGLDPTLKQIYAIKRNSRDGKGTMTIQTSIDGLRLIADRSGNYCPGKEPMFNYDKEGKLFSATAFIKKRTRDGNWHEVSATAIVSEYKPKYANDFWDNKTHLMAAKCAEALALRKAFPAEMAGVYADEEMSQGIEIEVTSTKKAPIEPKKLSMMEKPNADHIAELKQMIKECPTAYQNDVEKFMVSIGHPKFETLPLPTFEKIMKRTLDALEEMKKAQDSSFAPTELEEAVNE